MEATIAAVVEAPPADPLDPFNENDYACLIFETTTKGTFHATRENTLEMAAARAWNNWLTRCALGFLQAIWFFVGIAAMISGPPPPPGCERGRCQPPATWYGVMDTIVWVLGGWCLSGLHLYLIMRSQGGQLEKIPPPPVCDEHKLIFRVERPQYGCFGRCFDRRRYHLPRIWMDSPLCDSKQLGRIVSLLDSISDSLLQEEGCPFSTSLLPEKQKGVEKLMANSFPHLQFHVDRTYVWDPVLTCEWRCSSPLYFYWSRSWRCEYTITVRPRHKQHDSQCPPSCPHATTTPLASARPSDSAGLSSSPSSLSSTSTSSAMIRKRSNKSIFDRLFSRTYTQLATEWEAENTTVATTMDNSQHE